MGRKEDKIFNSREREAIGVFLHDLYHHKTITARMKEIRDKYEKEEVQSLLASTSSILPDAVEMGTGRVIFRKHRGTSHNLLFRFFGLAVAAPLPYAGGCGKDKSGGKF